MSTPYTPAAADSLFPSFVGRVFNDPGSAAFSAHNADRCDAKFFGKPIQDELLKHQALLLSGGVSLNVRNNSGSTIIAGPVRISGYDATNSRFEILAANATGSAAADFVLLAQLLTATNGTVYIGGTLASSGVNTAASAVGNPVYLAAGGGMTLTAPTGADQIQQVVARVKTLAASGTLELLVYAPSKLGTAWLQDIAATVEKLAEEAQAATAAFNAMSFN